MRIKKILIALAIALICPIMAIAYLLDSKALLRARHEQEKI